MPERAREICAFHFREMEIRAMPVRASEICAISLRANTFPAYFLIVLFKKAINV